MMRIMFPTRGQVVSGFARSESLDTESSSSTLVLPSFARPWLPLPPRCRMVFVMSSPRPVACRMFPTAAWTASRNALDARYPASRPVTVTKAGVGKNTTRPQIIARHFCEVGKRFSSEERFSLGTDQKYWSPPGQMRSGRTLDVMATPSSLHYQSD